MIFYFSGTGNSRWVACEIARILGDEAVDIIGRDPRSVSRVRAGESVGFAFPVYSWGVPEPMLAFVDQVRDHIPEGAFVFGVCTYGAEAGYAMRDLARRLPLDSSYGIAMPNNYVIAADAEAPDVVCEKIGRAKEAIARIAEDVRAGRRVDRVNVGALPFLKSRIANQGFNRFARSTKPFRTTDACDGCGLCARRCPASAIEMRDGHPVWVKDTCFQCLRCINECPHAAIQHGKGTESRGRHTIAKALAAAEGAARKASTSAPCASRPSARR